MPALAASAAKPATGHGDAAGCAALAGQAIAPNIVIQSAEYLADGGTVGSYLEGLRRVSDAAFHEGEHAT